MGLAVLLGACTGPKLEHYNDTSPRFDMQTYFTGPIKAWGIVQDRRGHVVRKFDVDMVGTVKDDVITLEEDFEYYDGETQRRVWVIKPSVNGGYEGRADDILDYAKGEVNGNALRWAYEMDLPVGDKTYRITFDDWMFQMNDGVLVNRSYLKKFGITVAELTLFMQKQ